MRVFIYWNLHRKCWSIKALEGPDKGRVKYHAQAFTLESATFKVSEAGRLRVIREQRKNVHAGVVGTLRGWVDLDGDQGAVAWECRPIGPAPLAVEVTYNPYKGPTFVTRTGMPVQRAALVKAEGRRVCAWEAA